MQAGLRKNQGKLADLRAKRPAFAGDIPGLQAKLTAAAAARAEAQELVAGLEAELDRATARLAALETDKSVEAEAAKAKAAAAAKAGEGLPVMPAEAVQAALASMDGVMLNMGEQLRRKQVSSMGGTPNTADTANTACCCLQSDLDGERFCRPSHPLWPFSSASSCLPACLYMHQS